MIGGSGEGEPAGESGQRQQTVLGQQLLQRVVLLGATDGPHRRDQLVQQQQTSRDTGPELALRRDLHTVAVYVRPMDGRSPYEKLFAVCGRVPRGMVCLNSALAYWDLSDEIPSQVHLAVPQGSHRPAIDYPPTRVHVFQASTFALGRASRTEEHGERSWISDRERSVVDAFRLRHLVGEDVAHAALRRYLQARRHPAQLAEYARQLRVWGSAGGRAADLAGMSDPVLTGSRAAGRWNYAHSRWET